MPLLRDDVERSLRILYDVRHLNASSNNDEEKVTIEQAIAVLEAQLSSSALPKSPSVGSGEIDDAASRSSDAFWSRYNKSRRSPVLEEGRRICVLEFTNVPAEGLGLTLAAVDESLSSDNGSRPSGPNGFAPPPCSIVIERIEPTGVAALDGRLLPGDQLLEVNRHTLVKVTVERAR